MFRFLYNCEVLKNWRMGEDGLETFWKQAISWSQIYILFELKEHNYTGVLKRPNKRNDK